MGRILKIGAAICFGVVLIGFPVAINLLALGLLLWVVSELV